MSKSEVRRLVFPTLLLLVAATSGCDNSGGMSHIEQVKHKQKLSADAIAAKGGTVTEKSFPRGEAWVVDLSKATIDDEVIEHIHQLGKVAELNLSGSGVTDQQLAAIAVPGALSTLIKLDVSNTAITDAGLLELTDLMLVFDINVKGSKITPAGIEQYKQQRPKHPMGLALKVKK